MATYPQPTRESTIKAILDASDRSAVPIRGAFIQGKDPASKSKPGPLSALVRRGRNSTLEQYLLLHAWASGGRFDVRRDSRVWARALGLSTDEAGRRTVGRNWKILSELGLVDAHRVGREVCATLLKEDGSGLPYRHPHADGELYLQLDYKYWAEGFHERLTVPGKADPSDCTHTRGLVFASNASRSRVVRNQSLDARTRVPRCTSRWCNGSEV